MAELLAANQITIAKVLDGEKGEKGDKGEQGIQGLQGLQGETGPQGETGADGYSPTVSTGTSSDGSTTVTVTNKDGSTTTTLVDGTARADIDTLSDKARSGYIETLSGTGIVQSNKTEDGGTSEVVVYGKSVQDGTPTPDAPIEIQSVRNPNVTACGKNLAENKRKETVTTSGVTYTYIGDGKYSLSGTATGTNVISLNQTANVDTIFLMKKNKTYKISGCQVYLKKTADGSTLTYDGMTTAKTITPSTDCILIGIRALLISGTTYDGSVVYEPIICETTDDIVYEPYKGKTATLSDIVLRSLSDGTRDRVIKDTDGLWKIERNCGEVIYNGTESSWGYESAINNCYIKGDTNKRAAVSFCSHFRYGTGNAPRFNIGSYFNFYRAETTTLAEWKTWLASNPITVVYALATPTYETLPTSIQEELNALTTYNPITNVMVSDGVNPDFDVSFWTRDYYAKISAENAAKVATNFIGYDSTNGLIIGNKTSGTWSGYHSQILPDSFNILDESSTVLASFGPTTIIGEEANANIHLTFNNLSMVDKDGTTLFEVGDNRNAEGIATIKHTAMVSIDSTGSATVTVNSNISSIVSVYADSVQLSSSSYSFSQKDVTINGLTANSKKTIEITYTTTESTTYLTFGERDSSGNIGNYSVAEGYMTKASGYSSHAEGYRTNASAQASHAEGGYTTASEAYSHAEGKNTTASGWYSHAEGHYSKANEWASHAEGQNTTASGLYSHAEGENTIASAIGTHAGGCFTVADSTYMTAIGKYNTENSGKAFVVGIGDFLNRRDGFTVDWNGNATMKGGLTLGTALSIANGGTGAKTAAAALANLGGVSMKSLWTNASPTSDFAAQTISLNLNGYKYVLVRYLYSTGYQSLDQIAIVRVGRDAYLTFTGVASTNIYLSQRTISAGSDSVTFGEPVYKTYASTSKPTANNKYCIPIEIIGIKGVQ